MTAGAGRPPAFWWREPGWQSAVLGPAAGLYGAVARRRLERGARVAVGASVICVGNPTVGGGGKTPTAIALARAAAANGLSPGFLSRGHGGALEGPTLVDPARHDAGAVGDEPLLLAAHAPTVVARRREEGARLLVERGCNFVVMDDGFQSARVLADLALLVVDSRRGLGNGRVVPAGPLRAPMADQMRHADALLVVGRGAAGEQAARHAALAGKAVYSAHVEARNGVAFTARRVLAFAGIADPQKFFATLADCGAELVCTRAFPDHHVFAPAEIETLMDEAQAGDLALVTTAKDAARLRGAGAAGARCLASATVLEIDMVLEPDDLAARLVRAAMEGYAARCPA